MSPRWNLGLIRRGKCSIPPWGESVSMPGKDVWYSLRWLLGFCRDLSWQIRRRGRRRGRRRRGWTSRSRKRTRRRIRRTRRWRRRTRQTRWRVKDNKDKDDKDKDDKVSLLTFRFDFFSSQRTCKIHRTITFLLIKTGQRISVELLYDTEEYKAKFCVRNRKFWCQTWRMSVSSSYKMYSRVQPNQKALNTATRRLLL